MKEYFNLLFPEWQGYGAHQEVYHGARHICNHVNKRRSFKEVAVATEEDLIEEGNILGRSSLLSMLDEANGLLNISDPEQIFMVGGTCACEIAPISFLNNKYDNDLAVFWFDAHGDLNTPESSPSHRLHGMPLRSLLGEGDAEVLQRIPRALTENQVALVGTRDLDDGEIDFIRQKNLPTFKPTSISHTAELIDFAKTAGFTKAYIHLDLDVLEPTEFPHVLVPVAEGMQVATALQSLQMISTHLTVVGCSVVEYCPKNKEGDKEVESLIKNGMGIDI